MAPMRPPPMPSNIKRKESKMDTKSLAGRNRGDKISLTHVQEVKVEIIDWKRFSVRFLLIIAYFTLGHLISYAVIIAVDYHTIFGSIYLKYAFLGFIADLMLYFFGTCAAVNAITYAWNPVKFIIGIVTIVLGILGNILAYFWGYVDIPNPDKSSKIDYTFTKGVNTKKLILCELLAKNPHLTEANIADEEKLWGFLPYQMVCDEIRTVLKALFFMPYVLPPITGLCLLGACFGAMNALYWVPAKVKDIKIDAAWLEPYETYDFYVGRNIPQIPGYDGQYEGNVVDTAKFMVDSDEDDSGEDLEDETDEEGRHVDKQGRPKKAKLGKPGKAKSGAGRPSAGAVRRTGHHGQLVKVP